MLSKYALIAKTKTTKKKTEKNDGNKLDAYFPTKVESLLDCVIYFLVEYICNVAASSPCGPPPLLPPSCPYSPSLLFSAFPLSSPLPATSSPFRGGWRMRPPEGYTVGCLLLLLVLPSLLPYSCPYSPSSLLLSAFPPPLPSLRHRGRWRRRPPEGCTVGGVLPLVVLPPLLPPSCSYSSSLLFSAFPPSSLFPPCHILSMQRRMEEEAPGGGGPSPPCHILSLQRSMEEEAPRKLHSWRPPPLVVLQLDVK